MPSKGDPILKVKGLDVRYPIFGGVMLRKSYNFV